MNFKILILFIFTISLISSCGVKGPPQPPPGTEIPPWENEFLKPTPK